MFGNGGQAMDAEETIRIGQFPFPVASKHEMNLQLAFTFPSLTNYCIHRHRRREIQKSQTTPKRSF